MKPEAHHLYEPPAEKARGDIIGGESEADAAFLAEVEALRADHQRVRIMLADLKFELALRALGRKYSPDQPRVPAGNPDGGQWTSGGGGNEGDASSEALRTEPAQLVIRICTVGSSAITTDQWGNQKYWAEYICADGHSFIEYRRGGKVPGFALDPRR